MPIDDEYKTSVKTGAVTQMKRFIVPFLLVGILSAQAVTGAEKELKDGDILFQESQSSQRDELKIITRSKYTHTGILFRINGKYLVFEAVQPVQFTPLQAWILRGKNRHYVVKRLKNADSLLKGDSLSRLRTTAINFRGRPYDFHFLWSDQKMYCSELVWKTYKKALGIELASLQKFADFDLSHPLTKALIRQRFGGNLPMQEPVISPAQLFHSEKLVTVAIVD